jgi:hypothetical protein
MTATLTCFEGICARPKAVSCGELGRGIFGSDRSFWEEADKQLSTGVYLIIQ